MDSKRFIAWLLEMKESGLARSDAAAGRMLGVHANTIARYKRHGADTATALACRALIHRMKPYGE
jgi:hypothetical protein